MVTKEEFSLIEKRFEAWNEKLIICCMGLGTYTKDQVLKHIKAKDEVGKIFTEIQLYYLRTLKERK